MIWLLIANLLVSLAVLGILTWACHRYLDGKRKATAATQKISGLGQQIGAALVATLAAYPAAEADTDGETTATE